jgi:hypothetical protein
MALRFRLEQRLQIVRALVLTVLFALPGIIYLHGASAADTDLWWHLRSGEWIVAHHALPQTDPFSAYGAGKFWAPYSWLFDVLFFRLFQKWGLAACAVYTAGMLTAIAAAFYRMIRRQLSDFVLAVLLTMVAMDALSPYSAPRPWLCTILIFIFEIDILMHARRTGDRRGLFFLPLIFVLWANLHIEFAAGLLFLGLAAAEPFVQRWWPQKHSKLPSFTLWLVFAACVAASCINPFGWRIYQIAYQLASMPGAANFVAEMNALSFRLQSDFVLLFLAFFSVAALAWNRRIPFFEVAMLAVAITVSFHSGRELYLLTVAATVILASVLPAAEKGLHKPPLLAIPSIAVASGALLWCFALYLHVGNERIGNDLANQLPVRAVDAIKNGHYRGPLFNTYDWGGYLMWDLRMPVSIDGRAIVYGDQRLARDSATWSAKSNWITDPYLAAAGVVIGPVDLPLVQVLRLDPRFQLVYEDKIAAVFVQIQLQILANRSAAP